MFIDYADIEIAIEPRSGDAYPFAVRSPGGEARGALRLPSDDPAYQALAGRLAAGAADEDLLAAIGQALFGALFQGAAKDLLARSQGTLGDRQGLRLQLRLPPGDAALVALPWELLHDPEQGPLALLDTPIARYLPQPTRLPALKADLPLKVLLAGAADQPAAGRALAEIQAALAPLADHVACTVEPSLTAARLQQLLRAGFHIWHWVGRSAPGGLALGGEVLSAAQLGIMLNRSGLRLVVLDDSASPERPANALAAFAPALLRAQIPALVTFQFGVPPESARAFSGELYRALAEGFPIDACVTEGRKALMGTAGLGRPDWAAPVVYTRAPDGQLFELPALADLPGAIVALSADGRAATRVTVDSRAGTLLGPAARPTIERVAQRPRPPRPIRGFVDRQAEQQALIQELAPGRGAWISGPDGCGISALLRQAANSDTARAIPDGVVFVGAADAPAHPDDLLQRLFERFYTSDVAVRVPPETAGTYLSNLRALFIFDELPLGSDVLVSLADRLVDSTVLIAASGAAPDTLLGLPLAGLPRAEARDLLAAEAQSSQVDSAQFERLCAELGDLPQALVLAGTLIRRGLASPKQLADVLAEMADERDPLGRAARLVLAPLSDPEREVLATLVHIGGVDAELDAIAALSQIPLDAAGAALARLCDLRLVEAGGDRYAVATDGLRRVLDRLLAPGQRPARAAAFFAGAAALKFGDLAWAQAELSNLLAALKASLAAGQLGQAGALARAIQPALTLGGRWGQWGQLIDAILPAAERAGDRALYAWALHERGARAGLLGQASAAAADLSAAEALRKALGDTRGADASARALAYLQPPPPPISPNRQWPAALKWAGAIALVLLALLGGAALIPALAGDPPQPTATLAPATAAATAPVVVVVPTVASTPTSTATPTATPTKFPTDTPAPTAAPTSAPTDTPTELPTNTPTVTPTPEPLCRVIARGANLRAGPGRVYPVVGALSAGAPIAPIARDPSGFWVQGRAGRLVGWLSTGPGVLDCNFSVDTLPVGDIPPTPAPSATPTDPPTATPTDPPTATPTDPPTATPLPIDIPTETPTPRRRPTPRPRPTATLPIPG